MNKWKNLLKLDHTQNPLKSETVSLGPSLHTLSLCLIYLPTLLRESIK